MLNNVLLGLILLAVIFITSILTWEFLDLNDFRLFKRKVTIEPPPMATPDQNNPFKIVNVYTGVTLADICELCPRKLFRVRGNDEKIVCIDTEAIEEKKLEFYRTIFIKKINAKNYELELINSDELSLL
jgi:hypothetical protein